MSVLRFVLMLPFFAACALLALACGDDSDNDSSERTCGDQICSPSQCESTVRCPADCGACDPVSDVCDPAGTSGTCGQPCDSSCECANNWELCTADYGDLPGRCIPTPCLQCSTFESCSFSADANGFCSSAACVTNPP